MKAHTKQSGFTLIELVVVIVILGILAATALPKFIDLKADAEDAAVKGVAGGVNSAFAVNYAGYMVNATKGSAVAGAAVDIQAVAAGIMAGGVPTGFTLVNGASNVATVACGTAGAGVSITVSNPSHTTNKTARATLICTA